MHQTMLFLSLTLSALFSLTFATTIPTTPRDENPFPNPYPDCHRLRSGREDHCYAGMRTHPSTKSATISLFDRHCTLLTTALVPGGQTISIASPLPGTLTATPRASKVLDELVIEYAGKTWGPEGTDHPVGSWWWEPGDGEGSNWGLVKFDCPELGVRVGVGAGKRGGEEKVKERDSMGKEAPGVLAELKESASESTSASLWLRADGGM